jgi:hypothetical protein
LRIDRLTTGLAENIGKTRMAVISSFRRFPRPHLKIPEMKHQLHTTSKRDRKIALLCSAIRSRCVIEFHYHGDRRTAEPFCLGTLLSRTDNVSLLAYQVDGPGGLHETAGWQLYRLSDIENIRVLDELFSGVRDGYDSRKAGMVTVYCSVLPPPAESAAGPENVPLSHDDSMKHFRNSHTIAGSK